ncbi:MAG: hypothetical protein ACR2FU_17330, partial [Streptosporangiaceae bacterium]
MLAGVVLVIGLGALISAITASQHHAPGPPGRAAGGAVNPVSTSLAGVTFAVIAFGVLGVMFSSGEYSTGSIRSSLTVVPRRLPVLWGKLAVFAGAIFPVSLIASASAFFVGQALLSGHHLGVSISSPGALRSVIGAALYVTVAGMIGVALGALLRSTAAGIAHLRRGVLRSSAAHGAVARLGQQRPGAIPADQRRRRALGRGNWRDQRPGSVDGIRPPVRLRPGTRRRGGRAARTHRRLTPGDNAQDEDVPDDRRPAAPAGAA